jgi:MFS family permease
MTNLFQQALPFHSLNRDLKILFVSNIFASFGDGLTIYLLPLFIRNLGASPENVGFLYSILVISSAITIIPGGFLADRYDRKKILVLAWAIWLPVPLFFVFATHWTQLFLAMFLYGVLFSGPASSAYIIGRAEKSKVTSTFTMLASAWGIGYTFAPTVAGYLAETVGVQTVFFLTTIFYLVTTIATTQISSQHPQETEFSVETEKTATETVDFKRWKIFFLSALFAAAMFVLSLMFPLVPQFLEDVYKYNTAQIGILGSFTYLGGSTLSLVVGKIGDKYGKTTCISVSMFSVAVALSIFILTNNFAVLIFASFLRGASFPMWAFVGATVGSITPTASRARWISVVQTIVQVVSILAPYVGGVLYVSSPQAPFLITIVASFLLAFIALAKPFKE